jgi:hypothetical protein
MNERPPDGQNTVPYTLICLTAQGVLLAVLLQRVQPQWWSWALFPFVVGVFAVLFRWRSGPLLFLGALAGYGYIALPRAFEELRPQLSDWLVCGAVLAYVAGQYRLQGLTVYLFPPDPRLPRRPKARADCRPEQTVSSREFGQFLLTVALWAAAGQIVIRLVPRNRAAGVLGPVLGPLVAWRINLPDGRLPVGQLLLWAWVVTGLGLVGVAVFHYLRARRMTPDEAALFLQDTLWRETRREQRRQHQWQVWARLRRQRREEKA